MQVVAENKGLCWWVRRAVFIFLVTAPSWMIIIAYGCCHLTACVCFSSFALALTPSLSTNASIIAAVVMATRAGII